MSKTYAIADLHGRFDLLSAAYDRLRDIQTPGTIVHLGDYVDRGPQSREIIGFLMDDATVPPGWRRVCLKGNHEAMMAQVCATPGLIKWWLQNGGGSTLISYGAAIGQKADVGIVPVEHVQWLHQLPLYHEDANRVFVHAGVKDGIPLPEQDDETLLWMLYPDGAEDGYGDKHVVHGHHQFESGPLLFQGRTDLDTFAWYTGRLVVGVFDDDKPGGPSGTMEIIGQSIQGLRAAA
jgi:serine/threonine protein phosphatase 1